MKSHHDVTWSCSGGGWKTAGVSPCCALISRDSRFIHSEWVFFLKSCQWVVAKDNAFCPITGVVHHKLEVHLVVTQLCDCRLRWECVTVLKLDRRSLWALAVREHVALLLFLLLGSLENVTSGWIHQNWGVNELKFLFDLCEQLFF